MIALLAPVALQVASPIFAPPLDRAVAYTVREVREDGDRVQRFAIDRRVTFRQATGGYIAEVDTLAVTGNAGRAGKMFEAMARSALGKRIVLRLDSGGKVVDVDDLDAVWDAQLATLTNAFTDRDPSRTALLDALLAPLRSAARADKVARIGAMISPLIVDRAVTVSPARAITLAARGLDGRTTMLAGTERVVALADHLLSQERDASGIAGGTSMSVAIRRRIDSARGLVLETSNIETVDTGTARLIVKRTVTTTP